MVVDLFCWCQKRGGLDHRTAHSSTISAKNTPLVRLDGANPAHGIHASWGRAMCFVELVKHRDILGWH